MTPACPLCGNGDAAPLGVVHGRAYYDCAVCGLAFLDPGQRPTPAEARARYDTHRNDPEDGGYRAFLAHLVEPMIARVPAGAVGLDYGSGPGPTLSRMMRDAGRPTENYDPIYAADTSLLSRTYDFITCSETAEHFFDPAAEFARLDHLLRPGGTLGVMTTMRDDTRSFAEWWYVRDPTHVCFYRPRTMEWIAGTQAWALELPQTNVALFRKGDA